ncbi:hypothetical protein C0J52_13918 [Blattella germanica]|nr:hypothetical protein C0J52_13918 [Blattella germanica]
MGWDITNSQVNLLLASSDSASLATVGCDGVKIAGDSGLSSLDSFNALIAFSLNLRSLVCTKSESIFAIIFSINSSEFGTSLFNHSSKFSFSNVPGIMLLLALSDGDSKSITSSVSFSSVISSLDFIFFIEDRDFLVFLRLEFVVLSLSVKSESEDEVFERSSSSMLLFKAGSVNLGTEYGENFSCLLALLDLREGTTELLLLLKFRKLSSYNHQKHMEGYWFCFPFYRLRGVFFSNVITLRVSMFSALIGTVSGFLVSVSVFCVDNLSFVVFEAGRVLRWFPFLRAASDPLESLASCKENWGFLFYINIFSNMRENVITMKNMLSHYYNLKRNVFKSLDGEVLTNDLDILW